MERIGILLTLIWSLIFGLLIYIKWQDAITMSLNEWGDFLAGATAPVAFLWLIIGYLLQRKELSLNTQALIDQAHELKVQNEYLKVTADAAQQQMANEKLNRLEKSLF